jgi:hypothetical protein
MNNKQKENAMGICPLRFLIGVLFEKIVKPTV